MNEEPNKPGAKVGWILMITAMVGLTAIIISQFTDAADLWRNLTSGNVFWISAGIGAHLAYFVGYAFLYELGFAIVGVASQTLRLVSVMMAAIFIRAVIPSGGASAAALFIDDAVRRGQSGPRATVGVLLVLLVDLLTLLPFIIWGLVVLVQRNVFTWYDAWGAAAFMCYMSIIAAMLFLADQHSHFVLRFLDWIRRMVNYVGSKFHSRELVSGAWPQKTADQFAQAAQAMIEQPRRLGLMMVWGVIVHIINLAGLWAFVKAFGQHVAFGGLLAAFAMGIVFFVVGIIPEGVAIVEAIMALVFSSFGMSRDVAITIAMVFRGVNFWLPLFVGLFCFHCIERFGERPAEHKTAKRPPDFAR